MAEFRSIHCKTWRDDWFSELPTDAKLLWLYLITNQSTSVSGIYQLPRKFMAFETGLEISRVTQILDMFKSDGKIDFDDSVIWIKKMREYQSSGSEKVQTRIMSDFNTLPDCRIKGIYAQKYGIDTVSIVYPRSSSDTDTDTDTETDTDTIPKTDTVSAAIKAALPRAAQVYIDAGGKFPSGKLADGTTKKAKAINMICETVKDSDGSLDLWRRVVEAYCLQWSSKSYAVMLNEYYLQNRIPGQSRNGQGHNNGHNQKRVEQPYTAEDLARAERINARRAAKAAGML